MQWIKATICKKCGVPAVWASWMLADSDNVTIDTNAKMRGVFFETEEVQNIFSKIEETLSIPFSRVYLEAHKEVVRHLFEGALLGVTGDIARKLAPRTVLHRMATIAPMFGVGTIKVRKFRRGKYLTIETSNVWNEVLINSDVGGAFEALAQYKCDVEGQWTGDTYIQTAKKRTTVLDEFEGRFKAIESASTGTMDIPKCPQCSAPVSLQIFEWNAVKGEITERDTGLRVVYETPASVDSLVFELEREIGSDIHDLVIRIEADYVKDKILSGTYYSLTENKDSKDSIIEYINLIRRRGFGNPTEIAFDDSDLHVTIRNPGSNDVVTGRILGSYEAVTGKEVVYHLRSGQARLEVSIKPKCPAFN